MTAQHAFAPPLAIDRLRSKRHTSNRAFSPSKRTAAFSCPEAALTPSQILTKTEFWMVFRSSISQRTTRPACGAVHQRLPCPGAPGAVRWIIASSALLISTLRAQTPASPLEASFQERIQPIVFKNCNGCHTFGGHAGEL